MVDMKILETKPTSTKLSKVQEELTMGDYKRTKRKSKKQRRFVNVEMILDFIHEHKDKIENLPTTTIKLERRNINWGDGWNYQAGYEYLIFFADKSSYLVGQITVIEDSEDYAQADSWQESYCMDYYQKRETVPCSEVLEKLEAAVL